MSSSSRAVLSACSYSCRKGAPSGWTVVPCEGKVMRLPNHKMGIACLLPKMPDRREWDKRIASGMRPYRHNALVKQHPVLAGEALQTAATLPLRLKSVFLFILFLWNQFILHARTHFHVTCLHSQVQAARREGDWLSSWSTMTRQQDLGSRSLTGEGRCQPQWSTWLDSSSGAHLEWHCRFHAPWGGGSCLQDRQKYSWKKQNQETRWPLESRQWPWLDFTVLSLFPPKPGSTPGLGLHEVTAVSFPKSLALVHGIQTRFLFLAIQ